MQTRSYLTGYLSVACSIRNFGRWSRTAVCSSIGMFTRPNEIDPFHSDLAICPFRFQILDFRFKIFGAKLSLGLQPVVEMLAVIAAALLVALVGAAPDVVDARPGGRAAGLVGR